MKRVSSFQDRLSELCSKAGIKDSELARTLQVSKQTVSSWRHGTRSPKKPTIMVIAELFKVNPMWLMGYDLDDTTIKPDRIITDTFQARLKQALSDKGITASQLSDISGVGKSDISNYLNGAYKPKPDKVEKLASALNTDPMWLMYGNKTTQSFVVQEKAEKSNTSVANTYYIDEQVNIRIISKKISHILNQAQKLSPRQLDALIEVINSMTDTE